MAKEYEKSFIMPKNYAHKFLGLCEFVSKPVIIEDYYLDRNIRVRCVNGSQFILTKKEGEKTKGRDESEFLISQQAAAILKEKAELIVVKRRYEIDTGHHEYTVTMDIVETPLKVGILEIESNNETPIEEDIELVMFDFLLAGMKECPLSAWDYFRRKIGICGGPSSGKTETAKWLSNKINTEFGGNSYNVAEYATTFIQKYNRPPNFVDQFFVWQGQSSREHDANNADIIISDCPIFLSYIYTMINHKDELNEENALYLSKMYKRVLFGMTEYTDIVFMKIKNYKENGIRFQTSKEAKDIETNVKGFLDNHNIKYINTTYDYQEDLLLDLLHINIPDMIDSEEGK